MTQELPELPPTSWVDVPHFTYTADQLRAYAAQAVAQERERQGRKIETLLRGITDARCLIDPIWRHRMGAEQVREHVQRGMRCIDSAITDCRFTEPAAAIRASQHLQE